ncbi:signal recognition particle-docking protein FtsY [Sulfitobacter albidus]|uniref:Signal recognition particle receptor FtsY n=1 Tax=Sulfitobacter albidus TaxID=2829501 RepID=A0A975JEW0_9RHOB|nr:signal recognition particle-docking protein FtsY [Sulfitobacter albidus]QUJ77168.1 signal recognition particle-docking protein FtsY [Sulfitobacter albidus]
MAFFKKLKDRLFKSSSKIDEGLEAIVSDGGEAEERVDEVMETPAEAFDDGPVQDAPADVSSAPAPVEAPEDAAQIAAEARAQAERAAQAQRARDAEMRASEEAQAQRKAEEQAKQDAEAKAQTRRDAEAQAQREAEAQRHREAEAQARRDAEARREADQAAPEPAPIPLTPVAPDLADVPSDDPAPKRGILGRLMGRGGAPVVRRTLDDEMLEQLEELLITADMGVDTALRVTANMAEGRMGRKMSVAEIKELMSAEIARIMEPVAKPLPLYKKTPQVVLVVGVNGSGKTTTIGKLASQFRAAGKHVVIAAGDTFRAAAVEQLQVWGERAGVPVLTAPEGSDPASLAFDAMTKAEADGADLLMIDTAGRLQNRADLMEELAKIVRVIRKKDPDAPHNTLLVLDATTGQNAVTQVKVFQEISDVSGLVMTKLDGTAKGGVLVALADQFGLPIHAIGVGEQIDDLQPFDPQEFADALTGVAR